MERKLEFEQYQKWEPEPEPKPNPLTPEQQEWETEVKNIKKEYQEDLAVRQKSRAEAEYSREAESPQSTYERIRKYA